MAAELPLSGTPGCPLCKPGTFQPGLMDVQTCPTGTAPTPTLYNQLSSFIDLTGKNNFYLTGVGTRDTDTNSTTADIIVPDLTALGEPGVAIVQAWFYWNILASHATTANTATFDGNGPFTGQLAGWCNDTCWLPFDDGSHADGGTPPQNIFNRVYRSDVTAFVDITGGTYQITLPGISTQFPSTATAGSDDAAYPGCNGSQGAALFIIYSTPSATVNRRIITYDGAVLVTNPAAGFGGFGIYNVSIDPGYFNKNAMIATAVGDAQTEYSDSFQWNNIPFPGNGFGSYFNPNAGNLLFTGATAGIAEKESVTTGGFTTIQNCPNTASINIEDGVECIDWFLFAYIGDDNTCCPVAANPLAPYDQLSSTINTFQEADFVLAGKGTRDIDMAGAGTSIFITIPGPVIQAYLYWNVFADNTNILTLGQANFNGNGIMSGDFIGWGDNTCWTACDPGDESTTACSVVPPIKNRVYRLDVTAFVTGTNTYTVVLPATVLTAPPICTKCPNTPHYPGCAGTQGVALFVIYGTPGTERHIILYDGCAVLIPDGFTPWTSQLPGPTMSSYTIGFNTLFNVNAKIALAVGDAQDTFEDSLIWDNNQLPPIPNHFTPNVGNLLYVDTIPVQAYTGPCCDGSPANRVTVRTPNDCLSWFLFAYSAEKCTPDKAIYCSQPTVSNNNQHFVSP